MNKRNKQNIPNIFKKIHEKLSFIILHGCSVQALSVFFFCLFCYDLLSRLFARLNHDAVTHYYCCYNNINTCNSRSCVVVCRDGSAHRIRGGGRTRIVEKKKKKKGVVGRRGLARAGPAVYLHAITCVRIVLCSRRVRHGLLARDDYGRGEKETRVAYYWVTRYNNVCKYVYHIVCVGTNHGAVCARVCTRPRK